jgi:teichoic acid transport system ATP-binding protein
LNNINFDIKKGETVGIIGKNGSGKSTLLKILTGVLTPTSGTTKVNGRISSLLELGAGFNPELTGLENIYFNGTLMGYSRKDMHSRVEQIIEFADIGDYIDQPVKTYSSGMFVRLAFATAINVEPDVLIIDEALSVGDIAFQLKCFDRFNKFKESGKTIIFVTHALDAIIKYCNRVIVLNEGKLVSDSLPKEAVDVFKRIMVKQYCEDNDSSQCKNGILRYGDKKAEIIEYGLYDKESKKVNQLFNGDEFIIKMKVKFNDYVKSPIFAYTIKDLMGLEVTGTNTACEDILLDSVDEDEVFCIEFKQGLNLRPGSYSISFGCVSVQDGQLMVHDRVYDAEPFKTMSVKDFIGIYDPKTLVRLQRL